MTYDESPTVAGWIAAVPDRFYQARLSFDPERAWTDPRRGRAWLRVLHRSEIGLASITSTEQHQDYEEATWTALNRQMAMRRWAEEAPLLVNLAIPTRALTALAAAGVHTIAEYQRLEPSDLEAIRQLGPKGRAALDREIAAWLHEHRPPPPKVQEHLLFSGIIRDHYSQIDGRGHAPYQRILHDMDDRPGHQLYYLMRDLQIPPDRRIEVVVRVTDEDVPMGRDPWVLLRPHHYGRRSSVETCWQCGRQIAAAEAIVFGWSSLRAWATGRVDIEYHRSYPFTDQYGGREQTLASCEDCWPHALSRAKESDEQEHLTPGMVLAGSGHDGEDHDAGQ